MNNWEGDNRKEQKLRVAKASLHILARYLNSDTPQQLVECVVKYAENPTDELLLTFFDLLYPEGK